MADEAVENVPEVKPTWAAVPTLTLSADNHFDLLALIQVVRSARTGELKSDRLRELESKLREFELYEEAHR